MKENIAKSSAKSKELILASNSFGVALSSDRAFCVSNNTGTLFMHKLKNNGLNISPCLSPIDVLNRIEACLL